MPGLVFVNDPTFGDVPLVGSGQTLLVAERKASATAARWDKGVALEALAAFLGPKYEVIAGQLYRNEADGLLRRMDLSRPFVVLRLASGQTQFVTDGQSFKSEYAKVAETASPPGAVSGGAAAVGPDDAGTDAAGADSGVSDVSDEGPAATAKTVKKNASNQSGGSWDVTPETS